MTMSVAQAVALDARLDNMDMSAVLAEIRRTVEAHDRAACSRLCPASVERCARLQERLSALYARLHQFRQAV